MINESAYMIGRNLALLRVARRALQEILSTGASPTLLNALTDIEQAERRLEDDAERTSA